MDSVQIIKRGLYSLYSCAITVFSWVNLELKPSVILYDINSYKPSIKLRTDNKTKVK